MPIPILHATATIISAALTLVVLHALIRGLRALLRRSKGHKITISIPALSVQLSAWIVYLVLFVALAVIIVAWVNYLYLLAVKGDTPP